jgi:hypothetical protein
MLMLKLRHSCLVLLLKFVQFVLWRIIRPRWLRTGPTAVQRFGPQKQNRFLKGSRQSGHKSFENELYCRAPIICGREARPVLEDFSLRGALLAALYRVTGLHNINIGKQICTKYTSDIDTESNSIVYPERAALQKNKSSNDALALKAKQRVITHA